MENRLSIAGNNISLKYTMNALCALEEHAGGSLDSLMEKQYSAVRLLLWSGMLHANKALSIENVGDMISKHVEMGGTLEEIVEACASALECAGFFADNK